MSMKASYIFKTLCVTLFRILCRNNSKILYRNASSTNSKNYNFSSFVNRDLSKRTLVFSLEGALLKSPYLFPYFMLVSFEAGSFFRALLLFLSYPIIYFLNEETGLKIMVMIAFFGIKEENFRVGKSVLPKFFLEDVALEMFEILKKGGKRIAISGFPKVMIESFLKDYLEIDDVVGRELKVWCGYFVGVLEEKKKDHVEEIHGEGRIGVEAIGITSLQNSVDCHQLFSHCKEIYLVRNKERKSWQQLPRHKYPKPLIFHDGRLAFKPTLLATLIMFMWTPLGLVLSIIRAVVSLTLPYHISIPFLSFSGLHLTVTHPKCSPVKNKGGILYACNHRTLVDPLSISFVLKKNNMVAVTYSLSSMSEILSPIRTVRLTRDRDIDRQMMESLLNKGDLVVCPEGTTCREPYLLRLSPLFSEVSDVIVPVAINTDVSMFYGTTASGFKCFDPIFFLMNPRPTYTVQILECVSGSSTCGVEKSTTRFDVANYVQKKLGEALDFECTKLTRKDKYLILAGNEGIVRSL